MKVLRLVANFATPDPAALADFYRRLLDLDVVMDHGWIITLAAPDDVHMRPQLGLASEGGSGTPVPELSIEVDDVAEVHRRALALGAELVHPLTEEPWGVRRFFVRDPAGRVLNVLEHL